jgi:hypothetical protein
MGRLLLQLACAVLLRMFFTSHPHAASVLTVLLNPSLPYRRWASCCCSSPVLRFCAF